ncbi:MAG: class I SAM-dependent methyltransferase [Bacteroidetes bacterium]|nr:class I SAM-dependent methyltransferase [Bacteroidota bacterium]
MNDEQNDFYTSISKYYSEIFPYNPMQLQFVKNCLGSLKENQILDIGCATGELAFKLANEGAKITGIDLNKDLLSQAIGCSGFQSADSFKRESEFASSNPKFQVGNMLELETDFQLQQLDAVLCFGNTLVHLPTVELIQQMLKGVHSVLKPGGRILIQILNYDYILKEQIAELPLIETENIKFIRKYKFNINSPTIRFQTELYLKKEQQIVSNETSLLALGSSELVAIIEELGFVNVELYSSFKQSVFGGNHIPLILKASVM